MDPTLIAQLMAMFGGGTGAAGTAGAGGLAGALGGGAAAPAAAQALPVMGGAAPMANPAMAAGSAFAAPPPPAMGSGMFGVEGVTPGVMQMGTAGPMGPGPVAQGTGGLLGQGIPTDDGTLSRLAAAPIDPKFLLKLASEMDGGGAQPRAPQAPMPTGGRGVDKMVQVEGNRVKGRPSLAQLLGGR